MIDINKSIEELVLDSIRSGLLSEAEKIIDLKVSEFSDLLRSKATIEIDKIMSSMYVSAFDNPVTLTREVHVSYKEVLRP